MLRSREAAITALATAALLLTVCIAEAQGQTLAQRQRRAKCRLLWSEVAPHSYDAGRCDFFCAEHELRGIAPEWYWSLVYGQTNFRLRVGVVSRGCYGPMDQRWDFPSGYPQEFRDLLGGRSWCADRLTDPRVNIRAHVLEAAYYHRKRGHSGMGLLRDVFCPAAPFGKAANGVSLQWEKTDVKFREILRAKG